MGQQFLHLVLALLFLAPAGSDPPEKCLTAAFAMQQLELTSQLACTASCGLLQPPP